VVVVAQEEEEEKMIWYILSRKKIFNSFRYLVNIHTFEEITSSRHVAFVGFPV
jgi:hypothetical protein